jgi:transposase
LALAVLTVAYDSGVLWKLVKFLVRQAGGWILFQIFAWVAGLLLAPSFTSCPPYCPDANRIERVWQDLHANVTRNHRCKTLERVLDNARQFLDGYVWRQAIARPLRRLPEPVRESRSVI